MVYKSETVSVQDAALPQAYCTVSRLVSSRIIFSYPPLGSDGGPPPKEPPIAEFSRQHWLLVGTSPRTDGSKHRM